MKWSRLRAFSLLASSVLVYLLSLFRQCCLLSSSISISSSSISISISFSSSFSLRGWICSMNSQLCYRIHHLIMYESHFNLNAFESRECSQCWIFERLFFCSRSNSLHLHHFRISMMLYLHLLHVLRRSSPIFRSRKTIAWSYHLRFLYDKKRINDVYCWRNNSFKSTEKKVRSCRNVCKINEFKFNLIFNENARLRSVNFLSDTVVSAFCDCMINSWWW